MIIRALCKSLTRLFRHLRVRLQQARIQPRLRSRLHPRLLVLFWRLGLAPAPPLAASTPPQRRQGGSGWCDNKRSAGRRGGGRESSIREERSLALPPRARGLGAGRFGRERREKQQLSRLLYHALDVVLHAVMRPRGRTAGNDARRRTCGNVRRSATARIGSGAPVNPANAVPRW